MDSPPPPLFLTMVNNIMLLKTKIYISMTYGHTHAECVGFLIKMPSIQNAGTLTRLLEYYEDDGRFTKLCNKLNLPINGDMCLLGGSLAKTRWNIVMSKAKQPDLIFVCQQPPPFANSLQLRSRVMIHRMLMTLILMYKHKSASNLMPMEEEKAV